MGRIRVIFALPPDAVALWFPHGFDVQHMAYVEWFTPFSHATFHADSRLYRIKPLMKQTARQVSVIPISRIKESIHLFPKFGPIAPVEWRASSVLDQAQFFYVNPFIDRFQYSTIF